MKKAFFYVGSNNETHTLEVEKITAVVSHHFSGFTAFEVIGYWKGSREKTLKIEVVTDESDAKLVRVGKELKEKLLQESVLLEITNSNIAFIQ